jgi:N-acetyl sugar amidotransferase
MPNTKPGIVFDAEGICSACRSVERKHHINWDERAARLKAICDDIRGRSGQDYECIVPVSGGKDSCYQVYMMSQVYKLRTLAIIVTPHIQTVEGIQNLNSLVTNLGVDLIKINVRHSTLRKIRRLAFYKIGNPNYAEHQVVFAGVARAALFYNAPLVVWGEDIGVEFGGAVRSTDGSADDLINNDLFRESSFDDLMGGAIPNNELLFYRHPDIEDVRRRKIRSIYLGYFHWWDGFKHMQVAKRYGFTERRNGPLSGNLLAYDNIDEKLCEVHIWLKFLKFGFWRPTDQCCYKIWNGYMTREEAVEHVRRLQYEFPKEYFKEFLEFSEITEQEFWTVAERWRNLDIWHKVKGEWRLKVELS